MKISGFRLKLTALILGVLMACSFCFGFAACGGNNETAKCTVTFDANGGHLTGESSVTVEKGSLITLVPVASKDGAVFEGWFTAATNGDKINLETYKVNADVKFYAHYLEALTVTFDANGGVLTGKTSATVGKGGGVATEDVPFVTKQGSGFGLPQRRAVKEWSPIHMRLMQTLRFTRNSAQWTTWRLKILKTVPVRLRVTV